MSENPGLSMAYRTWLDLQRVLRLCGESEENKDGTDLLLDADT